MRWITYGDLLEFCSDILEAAGVPAAEAHVQAWALVEAEARGHPSHGVHRLTVLVKRIKAGLAVPGVGVNAQWLGPAVLIVDGRQGLGPVVAMHAVDAIVERAGADGVAVASIANSNHSGMLALYVEEIVRHDLIGLAIATSEALVHPWGGTQAMLGTNPVALAVPATPNPYVLDMATSSVSMGKVIDFANRGEPLSPGWAIDADGQPTLDASSARDGALSPFGGAKGFGLALGIELLVGALTNSALGTEVTGTLDAESICNKGEVLVALNPSRFGNGNPTSDISAFLDALRNVPSSDPSTRVRIPGDGARERREVAMTDGIAVNARVWDRLTELHASSDVS